MFKDARKYSTSVQRQEEMDKGERRYNQMAFGDWDKGLATLAKEITEVEALISEGSRKNSTWNKLRLQCYRTEKEYCENGRMFMWTAYEDQRLPWQNL